jgi:hypothetical protein
VDVVALDARIQHPDRPTLAAELPLQNFAVGALGRDAVAERDRIAEHQHAPLPGWLRYGNLVVVA